MRLITFLMTSLMFSAALGAGAAGQPEGVNCRLAEPPESAGEEINHGMTLRIFPRARDIGAEYTGCQTLWAPMGDRWVQVSVTEVIQGDPVRLWAPHAEGDELTSCRYKNGRVISGDAAICAAPQSLLVKSMAAGCVKKIQKWAATQGLGSPRPEGCEYE